LNEIEVRASGEVVDGINEWLREEMDIRVK